MTPRRKFNAPIDNLKIQPIEIDTHVQFNGTAPLTNTTNSSSFSSSTDDSNYGFAKSPRLSQRNPVTGSGIQDIYHRGRKMDGRRGTLTETTLIFQNDFAIYFWFALFSF